MNLLVLLALSDSLDATSILYSEAPVLVQPWTSKIYINLLVLLDITINRRTSHLNHPPRYN